MNQLAFLAVATTGPDPHRNLAYEVSVIHRDPTFGGEDNEHRWQIRPPAGHADARSVPSLAVHPHWDACLTDTTPPTRLTLPEMLFDLREPLITSTIVAIDAARVLAFVRGLYARDGRAASRWPPGSWPSGLWRVIDVASLIAGHMHGTQQHPAGPVDTTDLVTLLTGQRVPVEDTPLGRVRWTRDLYDKVASKTGEVHRP